MAVKTWCWRCEQEVMMLDEAEWERLEPLLSQRLETLKQYRADHGVSLAEALPVAGRGEAALAAYREMTGAIATDAEHLRHHRRSLHGPGCPRCGKPLRTPQASYCLPCRAEAVRTDGGGGDGGIDGS